MGPRLRLWGKEAAVSNKADIKTQSSRNDKKLLPTHHPPTTYNWRAKGIIAV